MADLNEVTLAIRRSSVMSEAVLLLLRCELDRLDDEKAASPAPTSFDEVMASLRRSMDFLLLTDEELSAYLARVHRAEVTVFSPSPEVAGNLANLTAAVRRMVEVDPIHEVDRDEQGQVVIECHFCDPPGDAVEDRDKFIHAAGCPWIDAVNTMRSLNSQGAPDGTVIRT